MEPSLHALRRVKLHSISYTLRHWRECFSRYEKITLVALSLALALTSWQWALAASKSGQFGPLPGGTFIEGVVSNDIENIDLGHLVKASMVKLDDKGQIVGDLASKWEIAADNLSYTFELNNGVSSGEIVSTIEKNPTYFPGVRAEFVSDKKIIFRLDQPDGALLSKLTKPVFPFGPYKLDKKTKNEIRLKKNRDYFGQKPLIDKVVVKVYADQNQLQKAADKNQITGALSLANLPKNWQQKKLALNKKHILFINSAKTNLKSTKTRDEILNGKKPANINSLEILEVNGASQDKDYEDFKNKLKAAGIELKVRQVPLKDALKEDLPKRNYDLLYILLSEDVSRDPYELWNSSKRSSDGQNFAEVANATLDDLTVDYKSTSDAAKQQEIQDKINKVVESEKIAIEYKNLETTYSVSPRVKGFTVNEKAVNEAGRFDQEDSWYFFERKK